MVKAIHTLGEASKYRLLVVAECLGCGRTGRFLASDLEQWAGRQRPVRETPFTCTHCKGRRFNISCEEINTDRTREIVVWRPVKIKP